MIDFLLQTISVMYTNSAISHGLDPESSKIWGKIYIEYSAGMVLGTGLAQSIGGYKSLRNGFCSGESVVTGSGVGNAKKVEGSAGKGVGEANPQTGELMLGTADPTKKINVK